jgi:hypothetical protein
MFFYSVILNSAFIVHILVLPWIFKIGYIFNCEWLTFLVSRISILISLIWIVWLIKLIEIYIYNILYYRDNLLNELDNIKIINNGINAPIHFAWEDFCFNLLEKEKVINFLINSNIFMIVLYSLRIILVIIKNVCFYFQMIFYNYSSLLLGLSKKKSNFFNQPKGVYLFFLLTVFISLLFVIPRLYIIWCISIIIWCVLLFRFINRRKGFKWDVNVKILKNFTNNTISMFNCLDQFQQNYVWLHESFLLDEKLYVDLYMVDYHIFNVRWKNMRGLIEAVGPYDFFYLFLYYNNYRIRWALYELHITFIYEEEFFSFHFAPRVYTFYVIRNRLPLSPLHFRNLYLSFKEIHYSSVFTKPFFPLTEDCWAYTKDFKPDDFYIYKNLTIWRFSVWYRELYIFEMWDFVLTNSYNQNKI